MAPTGLKPARVTAPATPPARRSGECRSRKARDKVGISQPLSDGRGGDWPLPSCRVQGRGRRGGLWRAPRAGFVPAAGWAGLAPPVPEPGWLGGAAPSPPDPRAAGVSKVTLRCAAAAVAAGARSPPGLGLRSGSGFSRPGGRPSAHHAAPRHPPRPPPEGPWKIPAGLSETQRPAAAAPVV